MAWSTREVAALAGTTLNAVRHYHRIGLLDEPERTSNGYKQYEVRHLARLKLIRRLRDLGVPLDRIEQASAPGKAPLLELQAIDGELAVSIERLQRTRAEIDAILRGSSITRRVVSAERAAPEDPSRASLTPPPPPEDTSHMNYIHADAARS